MPSNLELKARAPDPDRLLQRLLALNAQRLDTQRQDDEFFDCAQGRLKLRRRDGCDSGILIFYQRPDQSGAKESTFFTAPADAALGQVLVQALGSQGRVLKTRQRFQLGRCRVHLDELDDLGSFVELEIQLAAEEGDAVARAELMHWREALGIASADLLEGAYLDLQRA